jgi:siroheme synthase-like protein
VQYFPIFVDGQQLEVLVVGGGEIATRKVELMLKTPAKVIVVSPQLSPSLKSLWQQGKIEYIEGSYHKSLLAAKQLVFVATANQALNRQISLDARAAGVLANVVDSPELCHFITPSIVDRSPMVFAISSGGKSPVLVRYWRERLEAILPQSMGQIAKFAGEKRQQIKQQLDNVTKRRKFWERFFASSRSEQPEQLESFYQQSLSQSDNEQAMYGELYVVETPSQPDLLTLAALRHMQKADIAIYDSGVKAEFIELIRRDADRQSVEINSEAQLKTLLKQGLRVCYLSSDTVDSQAALWRKIEAVDFNISYFLPASVYTLQRCKN